MLLLKVTDTLETVISHGKHALNRPPKKIKLGEIMLIAQSKSSLMKNEKSIRYMMLFDGFYEDVSDESQMLWGRKWKYIIKGTDVQAVGPFNITDIQVSTTNYQQMNPYVYLPKEDEDAVLKYIFKASSSFIVKSAIYPDEYPDDSPEYLEGKKKTVLVNTYERNPKARQACINHYGSNCYICDFDFGKSYGVECNGMIHVHHLKMVSDISDQYLVDPIIDLRPVCPNCHMVLHSKREAYTVDEVIKMMTKNRE